MYQNFELDKLEHSLPNMRVSVIIPTYNRRDSLARTLRSLQKQTYKNVEIIVVDNADNPAIERMINQIKKDGSILIRYIAHTEGGNSGARNRGVIEADGELLLFTDDDLTFDSNWVKAYCNKFLSCPEMLASSGCVKPIWEKKPPNWLIEYIDKKKTFPIFALMEPFPEFKLSNEKTFLFSLHMVETLSYLMLSALFDLTTSTKHMLTYTIPDTPGIEYQLLLYLYVLAL